MKMKKFFENKSVSLIAIATFLFSFTAQVAFAQEGIFEDDGTDYEGRIVVITDSRGGTTVTFCDREFTEYKAVIINPQGGPAIVTTVGITLGVVVEAGDRFDIKSPSPCGEDRVSVELVRVPRGR